MFLEFLTPEWLVVHNYWHYRDGPSWISGMWVGSEFLVHLVRPFSAIHGYLLERWAYRYDLGCGALGAVVAVEYVGPGAPSESLYTSLKMVSRLDASGMSKDSAILEEISVLVAVQQRRQQREGFSNGDPRAFYFPMVYELFMVGENSALTTDLPNGY